MSLKRKATDALSFTKRLKLSQQSFTSVAPADPPKTPLRSFCRLRPHGNSPLTSIMLTHDSLVVEARPSHGVDTERYAFTQVFDVHTSQAEVADVVCGLAVHSLFEEAKSSLILCYGIPDSGKTHTIVGPRRDPGLIPRALKMIEQRKNPAATLKVSYYEVQDDHIYDLLPDSIGSPRVPLDLVEEGDSVYVSGLESRKIKTCREGRGLLELGLSNRRVFDASVPQSTTIFTIQLVQPGNPSVSAAFVDLISPPLRQPNLNYGNKEARLPDSSLTALKKCLEVLQRNRLERKKKPIPFRDCKLTHCLMEFFIGRNDVILVINVALRKDDMEDTLSSLKFGAIAQDTKSSDREASHSSSELVETSPKRAITLIREMESSLRSKALECEELRRQLQILQCNDGNTQQLIEMVKKETRTAVLEECSVTYDRHQKASSQSRDTLINGYSCVLKEASNVWQTKLLLATQSLQKHDKSEAAKAECQVESALSVKLVAYCSGRLDKATDTAELELRPSIRADLKAEGRQLKDRRSSSLDMASPVLAQGLSALSKALRSSTKAFRGLTASAAVSCDEAVEEDVKPKKRHVKRQRPKRVCSQAVTKSRAAAKRNAAALERNAASAQARSKR